MNEQSAFAGRAGPSQDALVEEHAPLVKRIAYHLMGRLPANIEVDDLIQAGMLGLLDAARNFDATQGASFATYAGTRIRGAMWDEVRRSDWTPRSVHRKGRQAAEAMRLIQNREGRNARAVEVAEQLGVTLDEYNQLLVDTVSSRVLSLEDPGVSPGAPDDGTDAREPVDVLAQEAFRQSVAQAVTQLPERERLVMSMYYDDELNLREIGAVLGVSESRACQIHGQALLRLRSRLRDWLDRD